jgi:hypothetical protein
MTTLDLIYLVFPKALIKDFHIDREMFNTI